MKTPVVIMAGGEGTRLKPLTEIIPKPLVKVNNTAILNLIIEQYSKHGFDNIFVSVNHMADQIKAHLDAEDIMVNYIEEDHKTGTAGALGKISEIAKHCSELFVHNCDILINAGYDEILGFHKKYKNEVTIVTCNITTPSSYGEISKDEHGHVTKILEKQDKISEVVTGMYLLNSELLSEIPDRYYDMPELIESILSRYGKIKTFCVPPDAWIDVGQWEEYEKVVGSVFVNSCKNCGSKEVYPAGEKHLCTQCQTLM